MGNAAAQKRWRDRNRDELAARRRAKYIENRERELERMTRWRNANRQKLREIWRVHDALPERRAKKAARERSPEAKAVRSAYRASNPRTEYAREYETAHRHRRKQLHDIKQKNDPQYRIRRALRSNLYHALKNNRKVGSAIDLLGCSVLALRKYLEKQWLPGMNWDNYGRLDKNGTCRQIDHIVPLSSFDLTDLAQVTKVCHYTNLAPLWAIDNRRKGNKTMSRKEVPK